MGCTYSAHPKGVCARESQQQRLAAFFSQESEALQREVADAARDLQAVEGAEHLSCSSKLVFLDKLLCHLHALNCKFVPDYQRDYLELKRDKATYEFYQRHEESVRQALLDGRKPPRRPKRSELNAILEFRLLFERGLPPAREAVSRSADFLKEGLFPAEAVEPPELKEKLRLQKEARDATAAGERGNSLLRDDESDSASSPSVSPPLKTDSRLAPELRTRRGRRTLFDEDDEGPPAKTETTAETPAARQESLEAKASAAVKTPPSSLKRQLGGKESSDLLPESPSVSALSTRVAPLDEDSSSLKAAAAGGDSSVEGDVKKEPRDADVGKGTKTAASAPAGGVAAAAAGEGEGKGRKEKDVKEEVESRNKAPETPPKGQSSTEAAPRIQRLLVFTQFQLVLDELEAYCKYRGWKYLR